jgi:hypothetical protein
MFSFAATNLFTRVLAEYLSHDEYAHLEQALIADPEAGAIIPDSGGVRKCAGASLVAASAEGSASSIFCARVTGSSGC